MQLSSQPFSEPKDDVSGRFAWITVGLLFVFFILLARLWFLQIVSGEEYRLKSDNNHSSLVEIPTSRGLILDRNGQILVDNQAGFELCVTPKEVSDPKKLAQQVSQITGYNSEELLKKFKSFSSRPFSPNVWLSGLTRADLAVLETRRFDLEGLSVQINSVRRPIYDNFAPHIIGYLGEINQNQLEDVRYAGRRSGDLVGQSGIEQGMEKFLYGQKGSRLMEVDSRGRILEELHADYPNPGYNVKLTIDSRLQRVTQSLLGEQAGAIVVMDPRNFEILAMASSPTYDLADFVGGISRDRWRSLNEDSFKPMENRAVGGQYPPGSTFKIAVALAALAEGVITPETVFHCGGSLRLGTHSFGCWSKGGHGGVNLHRSLKESCDVYYYEVGRRLGVDRLAAKVREFFGLGRTLGVELQNERPGLIPDQAWKKRRFGTNWNLGETLPVSIGQGYVLTTPLQVAQYTAVVANGGTLYRPHLVNEVVDFEGRVVERVFPEVINQMNIRPEYLEAVRKGMEAVVNEPGGTGRRAQLPYVRVAGKTGTSQVVSLKRYQGYSVGGRPYKYRDHAWYTCYAPAENPEVVVTVLLEHAGGGGANSGPLAGKVMNAYFDHTIDTNFMPPYQVQPDRPVGWKGEL